MDTQTHKASLQLLTEHFGFVPTDFVDDVINSINELVHEAIRQLETFLSQHQDDDSLNALSKIETLLENAIDRNFDKFELYCLNNIFIVPKSNLLLPRYTNLHLQDQLLFDGDEDKEIHDLHAQILAEKYYTKNIQIQLNQTNEKLDKITCIKSQLESSFTGDHDCIPC